MEMLGLLGMLGYFSIEDIRRKSVHTVPLIVTAIAGVFLHLYGGRLSIWDLLGGLGIGVVMYGISVASRERVGKGDALVLGVTGIFLGFWNNLLLLWIASFLAMVAGIVAVAFFQKGRHYELPFVPFLFVGLFICLLINRGGGIA